MKRVLHLFVSLVVTLLFFFHRATAQTIKPDYAQNYDFGALKRFAWQENHLVTMRHPEDNKLLDRKIMRSVAQVLNARGIVVDEASPDFYIFYQVGIGDEVSQVGSSPTAGGIIGPQTASSPPAATWGAGAGSSAGFAPSVWYALEGQIVFYVIDSKTKSVVWQCRATKKWNDPQKARKNEDQEIKQFVEKSFKQFPKQTQK